MRQPERGEGVRVHEVCDSIEQKLLSQGRRVTFAEILEKDKKRKLNLFSW